jgi:hypothetical protein
MAPLNTEILSASPSALFLVTLPPSIRTIRVLRQPVFRVRIH